MTFTAPPPTAALGSHSPHPDSCPGDPTHGPTDLSSGLPHPPSACPGPEHLDPLCQVLAEERVDGQALGTPGGARSPDSEPLLGTTAAAHPWARPTGEEEEEEEEECPICTEPYGPGGHRLALLNCGHSLCSGCLHQLLGSAPSADLGRVRCPLCRQKTPMLEWEICRLQEELLQADGPRGPRARRPPHHPAGAGGPGPPWSTTTNCASWRGLWASRAACPSSLARPAWVPGSGPCENGGPAPAAWCC